MKIKLDTGSQSNKNITHHISHFNSSHDSITVKNTQTEMVENFNSGDKLLLNMLPTDILLRVCYNINIVDIVNIQRTSKHLYNLTEKHYLLEKSFYKYIHRNILVPSIYYNRENYVANLRNLLLAYPTGIDAVKN